MKKTILSIAVIAAAVFTASCQKENLQENTASEGSAYVFTATIETGANTKTTVERIGGNPAIYKTYWESTDQISIDGSIYTATPDDTDKTKATFNKTSGADPTAPFHAYFPTRMYCDSKATLPETYDYEDGKYNMPMYAESSTMDLSFKNLCGVLAITVKGEDFTSVSSIEVSSDKQMNGEFTAAADGTLTFKTEGVTLTEDNRKVTLTFASAKAIDSNGTATFYIPVPENTHRPLTIKISGETNSETNSETMVTNKAGGVEVERNTVYPITFTPIKTIGDVLATVEGGFPLATGNKWTNGCGMSAYIYGTDLILQNKKVALSTSVTKNGNCYTASVNTDGTLTFNMKDGILTNFEYNASEGSSAWDGKYVASIALPGVFSVSETKKVHFSRGNLWYGKVGGSQSSQSINWKFEKEQYSISPSWDELHVSNFYWSKTASVAFAESYNESGTSESDVLFTNATGFKVDGQTDVWRTLSRDEWEYLFIHHTYNYVSVNGKHGIVIAPDGFSGTIADSYSTTDWATAESNGFVFLPNTGFRNNGTGFSETDISCFYWTSTASDVNQDGNPTAYRMFFQWKNSSLVYNFDNKGERQWAVGIRLVTNVPAE